MSRSVRHLAVIARVAIAAFALAGCRDSQQEPAAQAIAQVEAALADAGGDAARYAPGDLKDVETRLDGLKHQYTSGEFSAVVRDAPAVLAAARGLQDRAVARVRELTQTLQSQWTSLATQVPAAIASARGASSAQVTAGGATQASEPMASQRANDAEVLWQRAVAEHDAGHLAQAVTLGHQALELTQRAP